MPPPPTLLNPGRSSSAARSGTIASRVVIATPSSAHTLQQITDYSHRRL